jgi:hypothetical protein
MINRVKNKTFYLLPLFLLIVLTLQTPGMAQRGGRRSDPNEFYRPASTLSGKTVLIPIGTTFEGRINTSLSSTKSRAGQSFAIILSSPILANGTDVLIPAGSQVLGEVVEAVPASRVPRQKGEPKHRGKLRIQVSSLRTPDGITYPLVASLVGESGVNKHSTRRVPLGTSVSYMGSSSSFEAVAPNMSEKVRSRHTGRTPKVVRKQDMLMDPILGLNRESGWQDRDSDFTIRSLVLKKLDYYIYEGSPLTVKLSAPLKMGITAPVMGEPIQPVDEKANEPDSNLQPNDKEVTNKPNSTEMDNSF